MSAAVVAAGLPASGPTIVIENAECVNKSYPGFWKDLETIKYYE
jgi:5-enolpyruvylshikimate-3-phosphate synthase